MKVVSPAISSVPTVVPQARSLKTRSSRLSAPPCSTDRVCPTIASPFSLPGVPDRPTDAVAPALPAKSFAAEGVPTLYDPRRDRKWWRRNGSPDGGWLADERRPFVARAALPGLCYAVLWRGVVSRVVRGAAWCRTMGGAGGGGGRRRGGG